MTEWEDGRIKCPFYKHIDKKNRIISCEPIIPEARTNKQSFLLKSALYNQIDVFCAGEYSHCPVFRSINREVYHEIP